MSARTIPEAAAELRVSPRALRRIVVENGLYIAVSNRKRITEEQYQALVVILKGQPCQSSHTAGRTGSTTYAGRTSASVLTRALELADAVRAHNWELLGKQSPKPRRNVKKVS